MEAVDKIEELFPNLSSEARPEITAMATTNKRAHEKLLSARACIVDLSLCQAGVRLSERPRRWQCGQPRQAGRNGETRRRR